MVGKCSASESVASSWAMQIQNATMTLMPSISAQGPMYIRALAPAPRDEPRHLQRRPPLSSSPSLASDVKDGILCCFFHVRFYMRSLARYVKMPRRRRLGILVDAAAGAFEMIPNGHPLFLTPAARRKVQEDGVRILEEAGRSLPQPRRRRPAADREDDDEEEEEQEEEDDEEEEEEEEQEEPWQRVEEPTAESLGVNASDASILTVRIRAVSKKATTLPDLDEGTIIVGREKADGYDGDADEEEEEEGKVVVLRIASICWGLQTYINTLVGKPQASRRVRSRTAGSHCYAVCEVVSER